MVFDWMKDYTTDQSTLDLVFHVLADGKDFVVRITEEALDKAGGSDSQAEGIKKCKQVAEMKISRGMVTTSPYRKVVVTRGDVPA